MVARDTYQKEVEDELEQVELGIQVLRARADEANDEMKQAYAEHIKALQTMQKRARQRLKELKTANRENWDDLRPRLEGVLSELRNAVANLGVSLPPQSYRSGAVEASHSDSTESLNRADELECD